jgi:hypothetical protein
MLCHLGRSKPPRVVKRWSIFPVQSHMLASSSEHPKHWRTRPYQQGRTLRGDSIAAYRPQYNGKLISLFDHLLSRRASILWIGMSRKHASSPKFSRTAFALVNSPPPALTGDSVRHAESNSPPRSGLRPMFRRGPTPGSVRSFFVNFESSSPAGDGTRKIRVLGTGIVVSWRWSCVSGLDAAASSLV